MSVGDTFGWYNGFKLPSHSWTCGYCNLAVGGAAGFTNFPEGRPASKASEKLGVANIYICPHCHQPTYFRGGQQVPGVAFGREVSHLPVDVAGVYREARNCMSVNSFTAAVLACRKLLMHIAVENGAAENQSFATYVKYLADEGFAPPRSTPWIDRIRVKGNEATHEIILMQRSDAEELLTFCEMLLAFIYEFPAKLNP